MNKVEELIEQLCPEGVEFTELGEVLDYEQPTNYIVESTKYDNSYATPVLTAGQTFILGYTAETEGIYKASKNSPVIIFDDFTTSFHWVDFDFKVKSSAMKMLRPKENKKIVFMFIYYAMRCIPYSPQDHARQWISQYATFTIPIPPLPIQQEIVSILDKFTQLEAELEAELEARKKQYEYYRDELLNFEGKDVEWKTLGEVCTLKAGKSISAYDISSVKKENYFYPCIGGNGLRGHVKSFSHNGNFPIIGRQGALCGNICFAEGKFYATEHAVVVSHNDQFVSRFLYYLLVSMNLNQYATGGAQPGLAVSKLEKLSIPHPPLVEQERIVAILDKFDMLVNDISIGLPAEISARRKQYEYYRGKLLDFKKAANG